eukprot:655798-Amphidinium_carterae.1
MTTALDWALEHFVAGPRPCKGSGIETRLFQHVQPGPRHVPSTAKYIVQTMKTETSVNNKRAQKK